MHSYIVLHRWKLESILTCQFLHIMQRGTAFQILPISGLAKVQFVIMISTCCLSLSFQRGLFSFSRLIYCLHLDVGQVFLQHCKRRFLDRGILCQNYNIVDSCLSFHWLSICFSIFIQLFLLLIWCLSIVVYSQEKFLMLNLKSFRFMDLEKITHQFGGKHWLPN